MKKISKIIIALFLCFSASATLDVSARAAEPASSKVLDEVRQIIQEYYVEPVNEQVLKGTTPQEIVKHLDPYSTYMTAEEYKQFLESINMESVGIGIMMEEDDLGIKIMSVLENGPAARAGLRVGDIITEVDGRPVANDAKEIVLTLISGQEGTAVHLKVFRPATNETFSVTVNREKLDWPNIEFKRLAGNIGYIRLYSFDTNSVRDIERAIRSLSGVKGWIFDLRDNPGGYVDAAQRIIGFFPNAKYAFQLRDRSNKPEIYKAIIQPVQMKGTIKVLVNSSSASASEMVAASVKEQQAAMLYGQRTFGKGSMQETFELSDGSVLKLTVAHFFSPKGTSIHNIGVKPNIVTAVNKELYAAHRDLLVQQLKGYQSFGKLRNVPADKTFVIKFSRPLANGSLNGVKLYHIGGQEVPVTAQILKGTQLLVKPTEKLEKGESYLLVIPPMFKSKDGVAMKKGAFLEINVAK